MTSIPKRAKRRPSLTVAKRTSMDMTNMESDHTMTRDTTRDTTRDMTSIPKRAQRRLSLRVLNTSLMAKSLMAKRTNITDHQEIGTQEIWTRPPFSQYTKIYADTDMERVQKRLGELYPKSTEQSPGTEREKRMATHIGQHWILERTWTWAPFDCRGLPNR